MSRKRKTNTVDVDIEVLKNLLWTSCRYCIGRHTYVSTYAYDYANELYGKISKDEMKHDAKDIRHEIEIYLRTHCGFTIVNKSEYEYDALSLYITFLNSQEDIKNYNDILHIKHIECTIDKTGDVTYNRENDDDIKFKYFNDLYDLIPWMDLANTFDDDSHYMIETTTGKQIECIKSYTNDIHSTDIGNTIQPYKYHVIYKPVKNISDHVFINEDMIAKISHISNVLQVGG